MRARPRLRRPAVARAITGLAAVWLLLGLYGAWSYVHAYYLYRGFPPPTEVPGVRAGRLVKVHFYSPALHARRSYLIYLPPGYAQAAAHGERFPVLYLLHAPPGRPDGYMLAGALNIRADELISRGEIRPFLVALPYGKSGTFANDTEWADAKAGRYEGFVLDTVRAVDRRWATRPQRVNRAIGGLSEGGYGAVNITLRHLDLFATVESWSGYFTQTPTGPFVGASPAALRANSPRAYLPGLSRALRRTPVRAFLYQGTQDQTSVASLRSFADELRGVGVPAEWAVYSGGHDWALWRSEVPHALRFANASFTAAGGTPRP